jgi:hypothetical protein
VQGEKRGEAAPVSGVARFAKPDPANAKIGTAAAAHTCFAAFFGVKAHRFGTSCFECEKLATATTLFRIRSPSPLP